MIRLWRNKESELATIDAINKASVRDDVVYMAKPLNKVKAIEVIKNVLVYEPRAKAIVIFDINTGIHFVWCRDSRVTEQLEQVIQNTVRNSRKIITVYNNNYNFMSTVDQITSLVAVVDSFINPKIITPEPLEDDYFEE